MGVRSLVDRVLPTGGATVVVECRRCGCALDADAERCPDCESTDIARYDLSE